MYFTMNLNRQIYTRGFIVNPVVVEVPKYTKLCLKGARHNAIMNVLMFRLIFLVKSLIKDSIEEQTTSVLTGTSISNQTLIFFLALLHFYIQLYVLE